VKSAKTLRAALFAVTVATWLICFALLVRWGTWTPFAVAGPTLAALALAFDAASRALLRPSVGKVGAGMVAGVIMIALTHTAFAWVTALLPEARTATVELYELLNVGGFSPAARVVLIVVVASSEEVLFRGVLGGSPGERGEDRRPRTVNSGDLQRITGLAACYALATLTLGSLLLVGCAFACGVAWGGLRFATRSLVAPITAHVVWDLGVLVAWPLV
jgi:membrane protease YdiL (CAAX protease family)